MTIAEKPETEFIDKAEVLSLGQVHTYTDEIVGRGRAEYNERAILVSSKHPLDQCLKRNIIEPCHYDSGKRLQSIRDCALSITKGRIYSGVGEGDSDIDVGTLYKYLWNHIPPKQAHLIKLICFAEPDIDGRYMGDVFYTEFYKVKANIQRAFEEMDIAVGLARDFIKLRTPIKIEDVPKDLLPFYKKGVKC